MTLQELRTSLRKRTGWANLEIEHDLQKNQLRWADATDYCNSKCVIGVRGLPGYQYLIEVYGRPFRLLTSDEQQFVKTLLCKQ